MRMEGVSNTRVSGGQLRKLRIESCPSLGGLSSSLNLFVPPLGGPERAPVLVFLGGLTCTEDNAAQKGAFFAAAAKHGVAMVFPDTSPRGASVAGEDDSWDFGSGAGFYVDADREPWAQCYRMESFITKDLFAALRLLELPLDFSRVSVSGHSMGGHGALTLYLKHRDLFKAASAFSPICNPTQCPWGIKAFNGYFVRGVEEGKKHDATELIKVAPKDVKVDILIDSGLADNFYIQHQLLPENFEKAAHAAGFGPDQVAVNLHEGYDHSYFFVSSFAAEHVAWHAKRLKQ
ncbi:esterase [Chytriomyces sp. MP71]|nr:esterase [Chytriomyces sp. MP71]